MPLQEQGQTRGSVPTVKANDRHEEDRPPAAVRHALRRPGLRTGSAACQQHNRTCRNRVGLIRQGARPDLSAQKYDQAVLDLSLFILLNPTYSPGYYARAQGYMGLNDLDNALKDVDQAIATASANTSADYGSALYETARRNRHPAAEGGRSA